MIHGLIFILKNSLNTFELVNKLIKEANLQFVNSGLTFKLQLSEFIGDNDSEYVNVMEVYYKNEIFYLDMKTISNANGNANYFRFAFDSKEIIGFFSGSDLTEKVLEFILMYCDMKSAYYSYDSLFDLEKLLKMNDATIKSNNVSGSETSTVRVYPTPWVFVEI
jgi:hypothetical protein